MLLGSIVVSSRCHDINTRVTGGSCRLQTTFPRGWDSRAFRDARLLVDDCDAVDRPGAGLYRRLGCAVAYPPAVGKVKPTATVVIKSRSRRAHHTDDHFALATRPRPAWLPRL